MFRTLRVIAALLSGLVPGLALVLVFGLVLFAPSPKVTLADETGNPANFQSPMREYIAAEQQSNYQSLLARYGRNKELPPGYELQTLLALSHYPELQDVKINFKMQDVSIPLSSRPWWGSLHRNARNRVYLVVIDTNREQGRDALLLKNQPFNAQIGVIGHELAHTVYYLDRSLFGILGDALCQLSRCRIRFEQNTDRRLVMYGLGWQRYDHAMFLRSEFQSLEREQPAGSGAYAGPSGILSLMQENPAYNSPSLH